MLLGEPGFCIVNYKAATFRTSIDEHASAAGAPSYHMCGYSDWL